MVGALQGKTMEDEMREMGRKHIIKGIAGDVKDLGFTKDIAVIEDF